MTNGTDINRFDFRAAIRPYYRAIRRRVFDMSDWRSRAFAGPSPKSIKDEVLMRNSYVGGTWVETGTFLGETTSLLAKTARHVFSLEPADSLFKRAEVKFASTKNVTIINAPSEKGFPALLPTLTGPVNFWLDGHYSAGQTFRGAADTPVMDELRVIAENLAALQPVFVLVDDIRCFDPDQAEYATYPSVDALVDWARKNGLKWHIEHDIFVAQTPTASL